jgi:hypothetical protein
MQDDHKFQLPIVLSYLDDARRIIEGGKIAGRFSSGRLRSTSSSPLPL